MKNKLSRREFLSSILAVTYTALLAGCQRFLGFETPYPKPTETLTPTEPLPTNTPSPSLTATTTKTPPPTATSMPTPTDTPTATPACFRLLAPTDGTEESANGRVTFTWEALPGAVKYILEITGPSGVKLSYPTLNTQYSLYASTLPGTGRFIWQVAGLDAGGKVLCTTEPFSMIRLAPKEEEKRGPGEEGGPGTESGEEGAGADDGPGVSWSGGAINETRFLHDIF